MKTEASDEKNGKFKKIKKILFFREPLSNLGVLTYERQLNDKKEKLT